MILFEVSKKIRMLLLGKSFRLSKFFTRLSNGRKILSDDLKAPMHPDGFKCFLRGPIARKSNDKTQLDHFLPDGRIGVRKICHQMPICEWEILKVIENGVPFWMKG